MSFTELKLFFGEFEAVLVAGSLQLLRDDRRSAEKHVDLALASVGNGCENLQLHEKVVPLREIAALFCCLIIMTQMLHLDPFECRWSI